MVVLEIVAGIILFVILVLCIPVKITLDYDESFKMDVKYLFFNFQIFPPKEKKEKVKPKKAKEEKKEKPRHKVSEDNKKQKEKKDNMFLVFYRNQGFEGVLELIKNVINDLKHFTKSVFIKHFIIKELYIDMIIADSNSADTAIKYGKISSAVFPAMGFICSRMKVRKYDIDISPDFLANEDKASFFAVLKLTPICLTNAVLVLAFRLVKRLLKIIFTNSRVEKERKSTIERTIKKAKEKSI